MHNQCAYRLMINVCDAFSKKQTEAPLILVVLSLKSLFYNKQERYDLDGHF